MTETAELMARLVALEKSCPFDGTLLVGARIYAGRPPETFIGLACPTCDEVFRLVDAARSLRRSEG